MWPPEQRLHPTVRNRRATQLANDITLAAAFDERWTYLESQLVQ